MVQIQQRLDYNIVKKNKPQNLWQQLKLCDNSRLSCVAITQSQEEGEGESCWFALLQKQAVYIRALFTAAQYCSLVRLRILWHPPDTNTTLTKPPAQKNLLQSAINSCQW